MISAGRDRNRTASVSFTRIQVPAELDENEVEGRPDRGLGRARRTLLGAVLVVGVVAAVIAWNQEDRNAAVRQDAIADRLTDAARSTAENAIAGLSGAPALVRDDGTVSEDGFEAFRRDVQAASSLQAIAYVPVVRTAGRAEFESRTGLSITELGPDGFQPAGERDVYWPVQTISPPDPLTDLLMGFDIRKEPITAGVARSAVEHGRVLITESVALEPVGSLFFILKPLYLPGEPLDDPPSREAAHVGFVVSVYTGEELSQGVRDELPDGVRFAIHDQDLLLAQSDPPPRGGVTRTIDIGERSWVVQVADERGQKHPLTALIIGITALILAGLGYLIRRSDRYERDTARTTTLLSRTADLAQHLAGAATVEQVSDVIGEHVPAIFGARAAVLGVVDPERRTLSILDGPDVDPHLTPQQREQALDSSGPLTDAVRDGELVTAQQYEQEEWRRYLAGSGVRVDVAEATRSVAGLALDDSSGAVVASIGILWTSEHRFDRSTVAALRAVTELCEQTLQRADYTDVVARRAAQLSRLAEELAGATTIAEAAAVITSLGLEPVGAAAASVGLIDGEAGLLRVRHGATVHDEFSRVYANPSLDAELAFTEAARTGEPVLVPDFASYMERYPGTDPSHIQIGAGARAALPLRDNDEVFGAIVFSWETDRRFDDAFLSTLTTIAEMAAQAIQRARLSEDQAEDAAYSRDLAHLAEGLATRAHTADVTGFLATGIITPLHATHAAIGLIRDGVLHRQFSSRLSPPEESGEHPETGRRLEDFVATPLGESTPLTDAARTGVDVLLGSIDELEASYPDIVPLWKAAGFAATANLPVRDRTGRVIGGLGVAWDRPVEFDKALRDRLTTIVGIAGQTLERARLADELRDTAIRNELLADFAQDVARVRTVEELCHALVERGAAPVGAVIANLALVDDTDPVLRVHPHPTFDGETQEQLSELPLDAPMPVTAAVREQIPVILPSPEQIQQRFPDVSTWMAAAGLAASVNLPLVAPDGTSLGALAFGWDSPQQFDAARLATMRTIAELCTQTLERTRLGESEHRLVASLQNRVVTPLPQAPGLAIAQRYRPAARHVGMGGDWYEGVPLDEHRYALVVGDVAGHGITAVADMIQLRSTIEALVRAEVELSSVFSRASALLQASGVGVTASACIFVVDTEADTLSYIVAGHPPPIVRAPDGTVQLVEDGRQPLLGIPIPRGGPATAPFPPGATLVAYTDGLIERRSEVIDRSIERLRGAVEAFHVDDVEVMADRLVEECLDDVEPDDDVALVIIERRAG